MNTRSDVEDGGRRGWFVAAAETVGDLGNPFYREERQRDVWNEASAVGFQLMLWLTLLLATVMVWAGGAPLLPYAVALFLVLGLASMVSLGYAGRLGVQVADAQRVLRARLLPYAALLVAFLAGVVRVAAEAGLNAVVAWGMAAGGAVALLALVLDAVKDRRRERQD